MTFDDWVVDVLVIVGEKLNITDIDQLDKLMIKYDNDLHVEHLGTMSAETAAKRIIEREYGIT